MVYTYKPPSMVISISEEIPATKLHVGAGDLGLWPTGQSWGSLLRLWLCWIEMHSNLTKYWKSNYTKYTVSDSSY